MKTTIALLVELYREYLSVVSSAYYQGGFDEELAEEVQERILQSEERDKISLDIKQ